MPDAGEESRISVPTGSGIQLDEPANKEGAEQSWGLFAPS
jgi:hypothetical protein